KRNVYLFTLIGVGDAEICEQTVAMLHERVPRKAQFGWLPYAFACQLGLGIGLTLMSVVGPRLAAEIVPTIAVRLVVVVLLVLRAEALHRRPSLDQRPINREVVGAHEVPTLGLAHN